MIPEPRLGSVISGQHEFDTAATANHYDALFKGMTAEECISFLEDRGIFITDNTPERISFFVERQPKVIEYSAMIALHFKHGMFLRSEVTGYGVL